MITLHASIATNSDPTRTAVGAWTEKTSIRAHNRLFGNECVLYSYRHEEAPYRISLYLSDYDTINLRVRSRKKRPPEHAQETLDKVMKLLIAEQAIPLEIHEHDALPDITTLEKPCYIKIRGVRGSPLYFANIDFQVYEPEYITPSLVQKTLDFSPAPGVKQWHINCVPVNPGYYAIKKAIQIAGTQLHVPLRVIQHMIETVNQVNTTVLNFMVDLIETPKIDQAGLRNIIKPHLHYNKEYSYLLRIIERMILANQFETAVTLAQIYERDDPHYVKVQALAEKALMMDNPEFNNKEEYLKNLVKTRLNIAMVTRNANDAMLLITAMNELAGGTGFLSQSQHDDNNPLGTLLVQASLAIRASNIQAARRTVPLMTTTATSPLQRTSQIQPSPQESVTQTLIFSQLTDSNSNYSLINSNTQASVDSPTSHVAVFGETVDAPALPRRSTI